MLVPRKLALQVFLSAFRVAHPSRLKPALVSGDFASAWTRTISVLMRQRSSRWVMIQALAAVARIGSWGSTEPLTSASRASFPGQRPQGGHPQGDGGHDEGGEPRSREYPRLLALRFCSGRDGRRSPPTVSRASYPDPARNRQTRGQGRRHLLRSLARVKARYDPGSFFRFQQSLPVR